MFGGQFPRRGPFAGAQADNGASNSDRLARAKLKIPCQSVALVEEAERGHAFRHRCADLLGYRGYELIVGGGKLPFFCRLPHGIFIDLVAAEPAAAAQQKRRCQY